MCPNVSAPIAASTLSGMPSDKCILQVFYLKLLLKELLLENSAKNAVKIFMKEYGNSF